MTIRTHRRRLAVAVAAMTTAISTTVALAPAAGANDPYGAIAYTVTGWWGRSQNYPTAASAQAAALNSCAFSDCQVLVTFTACGAVAANGWVRSGGYGNNLSAAMQDALMKVGGGWIDNWACN
ncbi:DUF4189 domain-containing protein [Mycobacterium noviomagense]|uniref:DUF4189 domain-containing protein n=1 Tax=Mycobacterium noviomagense TaxID=459858 RepID=A0A7I7P8Y0_9MYCO|nr:DUF4189 domain-containing protein [Mycobacterium noviomagense]ORB11502.1 hypothetical protein BST37_19185 [Mycobacterium noviomagense]BBY05034.1 hypothetical protein MNVI_03520 [Mycobacterium noviomagense]